MLYEVITGTEQRKIGHAPAPGDMNTNQNSINNRPMIMLKAVITSYSIHYTKLYESLLALLYGLAPIVLKLVSVALIWRLPATLSTANHRGARVAQPRR